MLDEACHVEMSFEIVSMLTRQEVNAGPLPESTHAFGQDIEALALVVAKEGCVGKTLAAWSLRRRLISSILCWH